MTAILTAITSVFSSILGWITDGMSSVVSIFWDATANSGAGSLTFYGVLAVCGLCVSIVFLIIGIAQRFLHFAG